MNANHALGLAVLWPLIGGMILILLGKRPNLRDTVTVLTSSSLFVLIVTFILPEVLHGGRPELHLVNVLPGIPLAFRVEPLGMLFALVASGLWIVTSLYAFGYMRGHHEKNQTRFFFFFALAIAAALGVAFSANVFTLFVFYEIITLSTFPLVTHHGTEEAKRSGRIYLGILLGTSVAFLLLAMIWTHVLAGTTDFRPGGILAGKASPAVITALVALYAFGTGKAALMPFHRWLPAAMVAPTPVSALLHAVAVVKAGVFTIMKIMVYVFGIDLLQDTGASTWLCWAAAGTILIASSIAVTKDNLKARLAYSTISQLSYIVLGAALAHEWGVMGGGLHLAMHAFGKITLFFCAGAIMVATHKKNISEMDGLGRKLPFTYLAFLAGSLSVIGIPPMGGCWSKWFLVLGAAEGGQKAMIVVLMLSSLLSIAYLMPVVVRGFFFPPPKDDHGHHGTMPFLCVAPPVFTAIGCIVLFFFANGLYALLRGMSLS